METLDACTATALQKMLDPLGRSLGIKAAWAILDLRIDDESQARLQDFADRNNEGRLSEAERAEYLGYVERAEILAPLKMEARRSLAHHGAA